MSKLTKKDDGWHDFVFTHFKESELIEDNPTCNGLRRVCEKVYGSILSCKTSVLKAPDEQDRAATVVCTIECIEHDRRMLITQSASADVYTENTVHPYNLHPVATAETRAEGRALRKLMGLDCTTYEEMTSNNADGDAHRIAETQARSIRNMSDRMGIDLDKFLAKNGCKSSELDKGPNAISKKVAEILLSELSTYSVNPSRIPSEVVRQDSE